MSWGYHNFGEFVSKVADLPRIVTLHDFDIKREAGGLSLKLQAKTYRSENSSDIEGDK